MPGPRLPEGVTHADYEPTPEEAAQLRLDAEIEAARVQASTNMQATISAQVNVAMARSREPEILQSTRDYITELLSDPTFIWPLKAATEPDSGGRNFFNSFFFEGMMQHDHGVTMEQIEESTATHTSIDGLEGFVRTGEGEEGDAALREEVATVLAITLMLRVRTAYARLFVSKVRA